nr:hypothetical protein [Tanacetum cinerariifolium]
MKLRPFDMYSVKPGMDANPNKSIHNVYAYTRRVVGNSGYVGNTGRVVGNSGYSANAQRVTGNNATVQRIPRTSTNTWNTSMTVNNDYDAEPSYDSDFANEKLLKPTYDDDQIDSHIIFDDLNVEENSENVKQDTSAHDHKYVESESLMRNVQLEAEKTKEEIKTVKDANALLTMKLEKYKERVWVFKNKPENKYDYMKAYNEALNRENKLKDQLSMQFILGKQKLEALKKENH